MLSGFQGKIFKCSFSDRQVGQCMCSGKTWITFHLNYFYLHQWLEIHTMFIKTGSTTLYTLKKKHLSLFQWPKHSSFIYHTCDIQMMLFFFFPIVFISWRLITLQYCSGFCHTLTWISRGFTCVPHPELPSHLPPHPSGSSQCTSPEHLSYAQMMLFLNTKLGIYTFIVVGSRLFNDGHDSPCYQGDSLRTHHTP